MGVIKSSQPQPTAAAFAFGDIERQAQNVLARAAVQAERLLADAQAEADAMRDRALAEGRKAGLEAGLREGLAKGRAQGIADGRAEAMNAHAARLAEAIATFASVNETLDGHVATLGATAEQDVLQLAIGIARRVVKTLADRDVAVVEANVREAVRLATSKASLRIAIHPGQRGDLHAMLAELKLTWPSVQHVDFVDDASIARGGCRVLTVAGEIDADIDRQLDRIAEELAPKAG